MGQRYVLPDLRYDYGALEPHIAGRVLELHHSKHHAAYVKQALPQLDEGRGKRDFTRIAALERALAFNLSGHVLHSIFWQNMKPKGGGRPSGELSAALERDFGDFEAFKRHMNAVAATVMG